MTQANVLMLALLLLTTLPVFASADEGITGDRLKLSAKLTLTEKYSDNIYWEEKNPSSDSVTTLSPKVGVEVGFFEGASLKLDYTGEFSDHAKSENFNKDSHRVGLDGKWLAPGGSTFNIGASAKYDAIQPWSEQDVYKPYTNTEARADILLKTWTFTDLGFAYSRAAAKFKDQLYARDEYTEQDISADILYRRYDPNVLFVGYTFVIVDAQAEPGVATGWQSHHLEIGIRWEPTYKLSGRLQGGYSLTSFEAGERVSDYIVDTDLTYRLSEGLSLKIAAARKLGVSASAAREFGDFYVSTSGSLSADYHVWERLAVTLGVTYENRTFAQEDPAATEKRTTKPLGAGLSVRYTPREWCSIAVGYWYSQTTATLAADEHQENIVDIKLSFAL